jgi:hypothetical protein
MFWEGLTAYFPWYDTDRIENDMPNISSVVSCVFVVAVTFLPSCYLAKVVEFWLGSFLATRGVRERDRERERERDSARVKGG